MPCVRKDTGHFRFRELNGRSRSRPAHFLGGGGGSCGWAESETAGFTGVAGLTGFTGFAGFAGRNESGSTGFTGLAGRNESGKTGFGGRSESGRIGFAGRAGRNESKTSVESGARRSLSVAPNLDDVTPASVGLMQAVSPASATAAREDRTILFERIRLLLVDVIGTLPRTREEYMRD